MGCKALQETSGPLLAARTPAVSGLSSTGAVGILSSITWDMGPRLNSGEILPFGYVKIAIEAWLFIVDFPIKNGVFP